MPYPAPFHRLVLIGNLYSDIWNTTLAMVPSGGAVGAVTDELLEDISVTVADWFNNTTSATPANGVGFLQGVTLTSIKLNRIGTDGRYSDAEAKEWIYPSAIAGPMPANAAPQLTVVSTLLGPNPRARAGRGRMYLPPSIAVTDVGADGRISSAVALDHAQGTLFFLGMMNDAYLAAGVPAVAGVASNTGAGAFQTVSVVRAGRVVDTMRSRRNKLDEDPQEWGTP